MKINRVLRRGRVWPWLHKTVTICVVASLLAGLIPSTVISSLINTALPETLAAPIAAAANALLPSPATAQAAAVAAPADAPTMDVAAAPLAQALIGSNVLSITKTISGTGSGPFDLTLLGPSGYVTTTTINGGQTKVLTSLASGVYTVTESTPAGWTTVYTATPGTGGSSQAVVSLQNTNTATMATTPISGRVFNDFNSDGLITANGVVTDTGVSTVTVTAYDKNGTVVGTATSDATGNYTINPTGAGPYRVVFSNLPSEYEPTTHGTSNGSSVQFVNTAGARMSIWVC